MTESYLIYVDDSGDQDRGVLFSALMLPAAYWAEALGYWISMRREVAGDPYFLPTFFEIHSQPFLSVRPLKQVRKDAERRADILRADNTDPVLENVALARAQVELADVALASSLRAALNAGLSVQAIAAAARLPQQDVEDRIAVGGGTGVLNSVACLQETGSARVQRREIFNRCLIQIAALPGIQIIVAATDGGSGEAKSRLYGHLLLCVDEWLRERHAWGTVVVDGTPSARTLYYREAHRALSRATRRILEDEVVRDSSESHFIQAADVVAYSAHRLRLGEPDDYLSLSEVIVTPDGERPSARHPGFFIP